MYITGMISRKCEILDKMHGLSAVVLSLVLVGYLFIGAAVFQALESDNEQETTPKTMHNISEFLANTSIMDQEQFEALILSVIKAYDQGLLKDNQTLHSRDKWSFMGAWCFCVTIITTVGYGHIAPSTPRGQVFCIFYALCGIPCTGVLMVEVGRRMSAPISKFRNRSKSQNMRLVKSVMIFSIGTSVMIFLPSVVYMNTERWTMLEAIYYTVMTYTTIGFGDYVIDYENKSEYVDTYRVLSHLWIFIGLSWTSCVIADVSNHFKARVEERENSIRRKPRVHNGGKPESTK